MHYIFIEDKQLFSCNLMPRNYGVKELMDRPSEQTTSLF